MAAPRRITYHIVVVRVASDVSPKRKPFARKPFPQKSWNSFFDLHNFQGAPTGIGQSVMQTWVFVHPDLGVMFLQEVGDAWHPDKTRDPPRWMEIYAVEDIWAAISVRNGRVDTNGTVEISFASQRSPRLHPRTLDKWLAVAKRQAFVLEPMFVVRLVYCSALWSSGHSAHEARLRPTYLP